MIDTETQRIIRDFPLGIVATITSDGLPAASPKGTFLVLDDTTLAFGDIRSPGTRGNLESNPATEVVFVDPFLRKGARLHGKARVETAETMTFQSLIPKWQEVWGNLADRISALIVIKVSRVLPLSTPPYDDGVGEREMVAMYQEKYAAIYPKDES